jgi:hypothetical protein
MRLTYADLVVQSEESERLDRLPNAPLLGFVVGTALALPLWTAIGWAVLALLG